jgi:ABC-type polysaccharide/polyol phosphate transport system ATPase subunit
MILQGASPTLEGAEPEPSGCNESQEILIEAENLCKKYCRNFRRSLWYALMDVGLGLLPWRTSTPTLRPDEFWAVEGISLVLRRGESLGLIGRNGAGKSTLLKMLTGQRGMTIGRVATRGRVVGLTELGLGFDPVLTGRENIYINAAVFGVPRSEIEPVIDKIIDFAGLWEFIDSAVQTYSSGMKARLGFSVAAHLDPDILIVDEVLAVGDIQFRLKCVRHILSYLRQGGSLILVTHDPYLVQAVCNRCVVLDKGRAIFDGPPIDAVNLHFQLGYAATLQAADRGRGTAPQTIDTGDGQSWERNWVSDMGSPSPAKQAVFRGHPSPDRPIVIDSCDVEPVGTPFIETGGEALVNLRFRSLIEAVAGWAFTVSTSDLHTNITTCGIGADRQGLQLRQGTNVFRCRIPKVPFCPGVYSIRAGIVDLATLAPLALMGYENSPDFFTVKASEANLRSNTDSAMNNLIEMSVEFEQ